MITIVVLAYVFLWLANLSLLAKVIFTVVLSVELALEISAGTRRKNDKLPLPKTGLLDLSVTSYGKQGTKDN